MSQETNTIRETLSRDHHIILPRTEVAASQHTILPHTQSVTSREILSEIKDPELKAFTEQFARRYHTTAPATLRLLAEFPVVPQGRAHIVERSGTYRIPPYERFRYFSQRAQDIEWARYATIMEQTVWRPEKVTLAMVLEFRFDRLADLPRDWGVFFGDRVTPIHRRVVQCYSNDLASLRVFLLPSQPQPRWAEGNWNIALVLHLIWNRNVTVLEGAQMTHAVQQILPPGCSMDSLYVKDRKLRDLIQLRPPYASKQISCWFCGDSRHDECKCCHGSSALVDKNIQNLHQVWNSEGKALPDELCYYQHHIAELLNIVSIWGGENTNSVVSIPPDAPQFSFQEIKPLVKPKVRRHLESFS